MALLEKGQPEDVPRNAILEFCPRNYQSIPIFGESSRSNPDRLNRTKPSRASARDFFRSGRDPKSAFDRSFPGWLGERFFGHASARMD